MLNARPAGGILHHELTRCNAQIRGPSGFRPTVIGKERRPVSWTDEPRFGTPWSVDLHPTLELFLSILIYSSVMRYSEEWFSSA